MVLRGVALRVRGRAVVVGRVGHMGGRGGGRVARGRLCHVIPAHMVVSLAGLIGFAALPWLASRLGAVAACQVVLGEVADLFEHAAQVLGHHWEPIPVRTGTPLIKVTQQVHGFVLNPVRYLAKSRTKSFKLKRKTPTKDSIALLVTLSKQILMALLINITLNEFGK